MLELRRVGAIDRVHHLDAHVREPAYAAEEVVDHTSGRCRIRGHHPVVLLADDPPLLGGVVIERERHLGPVGQVRGDVVRVQLDLAVLHVLGMDEQDVVQEPQLLQKRGADEAVKVATSDETIGAVQ